MNIKPPNLFQSLFDSRPRESYEYKENFLTESFAYLLRIDKGVFNAWVSKLLGNNIDGITCEQIKTRVTEMYPNAIYPDLLIKGRLPNGEKFAVYCEHKWESPCDEEQLIKYQRLATKKNAQLVFVGAKYKQKSQAERCFKGSSCKSFLWDDVFDALSLIKKKSQLLKEFLEFMKMNGLSPKPPLTIEGMKAFLEGSDLESLLNFAHKLHMNYSWDDIIPKRFFARNYVHRAYGRVGIRFETELWRPALTVGFLYDEKDHQVTLVNRDKGIDLLLRIEALPEDTNNIKPVLDVLREKRKRLEKTAASVLLHREPGNGNNYSVLIVRDCLADVIANVESEADQLTVIYQRLTSWLAVLFKDERLETAFRNSSLDSGMQ